MSASKYEMHLIVELYPYVA